MLLRFLQFVLVNVVLLDVFLFILLIRTSDWGTLINIFSASGDENIREAFEVTFLWLWLGITLLRAVCLTKVNVHIQKPRKRKVQRWNYHVLSFSFLVEIVLAYTYMQLEVLKPDAALFAIGGSAGILGLLELTKQYLEVVKN